MQFAEFRTACLQILSDLDVLADQQYTTRISHARHRLSGERVKLLVVGEFSRGKSTFINALVGEPLLPSRVTPTTASINIIRGGDDRRAEVHYSDGQSEHYEVPATGSNRFLSSLVTTANERSQQISEVVVTVPSRIARYLVDIVDTPGVNDLNKLREDVTFRYLKECDAVVVLLDAQQPLTESERAFLKHRVMASDITKMLFVVNRIDEQIADDDGATTDDVLDFVRQRLQQELGVCDARVYAVSALQALKARFRDEPSEYLNGFQQFEQSFLEFAQEQATTGRMLNHRDRILRIVQDIVIGLENEIAAIGLESAEVTEKLSEQHDRLCAIENQIRNLSATIEKPLQEVRTGIIDKGHAELTELQERLQNSLSTCTTPESLDSFQDIVAGGLTALQQTLSQYTWQESRNVSRSLRALHPELFSAKAQLIAPAAASLLAEMGDVNDVDLHFELAQPEVVGAQEAIFGSIVGIITSYISGGPILGLLSGIFGFGVASSVRQQSETEQAVANERKRVWPQVESHLSRLRDRLPELANRLVDRERKQLHSELEERARISEAAVKNTIRALEQSTRQSQSARGQRQSELHERKECIRRLAEQSLDLAGRSQPASPAAATQTVASRTSVPADHPVEAVV